MGRVSSVFSLVLFLASVTEAGTVTGVIRDSSGGVVPDARVVLRDIATGQQQEVRTADDGQYRFEPARAGTYLLIVDLVGFSAVARTLVLERADQSVDLPITLELGAVTAELTVTAARSERELRQIPLHIDNVTGNAIEQMNSLSTGDAIATAANVTPVGNGPFGVRPRLRGLDSTRLLILVDGERPTAWKSSTAPGR
jgi:hypothetical protein